MYLIIIILKSIFRYLIFFIIICSLISLGYLTVTGIKKKEGFQSKIQTLPQFSFQQILGGNFESPHINNKNSCLIIYFHPECDYCHYEAEQIGLNIDRFYNFQIIMISTASCESVKDFANNYHLLEFDNISVLIDTLDVFHNTFGPNPFPTSFIYNKERKLVKQFKGEVSTEALLKYLNQ
jgi:peroxiredoxin